MKAAAEQTEVLLLNLEQRARVLQDCSEKLETQLKVMLVQESRGHFSNGLVARIAHALAICLSSRGDTAQAGQYALMAANLEGRERGSGPLADRSPARTDQAGSEAITAAGRDRQEGKGTARHLVGPSSPRRHPAFVAWWSGWFALNRRNAKWLGR